MPFYINEAFNIIVGDDGPDNSKHLSVTSIKLPTFEEYSQDHNAGGAIGEIAIGGLGLKKVELTFACAGVDPQIQSKFGISALPFTIYSALRDKGGGTLLQWRITARGRLAMIESDEMKRGELMGHNHKIEEILHYEAYLGGKEKFWFDWKTSDWRIDGVSPFAERRAMLGIPGAG